MYHISKRVNSLPSLSGSIKHAYDLVIPLKLQKGAIIGLLLYLRSTLHDLHRGYLALSWVEIRTPGDRSPPCGPLPRGRSEVQHGIDLGHRAACSGPRKA